MTEHDILIERNREMTTRDGAVLRADVVRPNIGAKVPAIVARTPYDKHQQFQMQNYLHADHVSYVVIPVQPEPGPAAAMTHVLGS